LITPSHFSADTADKIDSRPETSNLKVLLCLAIHPLTPTQEGLSYNDMVAPLAITRPDLLDNHQ